MKCEKCGKEIPEGENKICDDCKSKLLDDLNSESQAETTETKKEEKKTKAKKESAKEEKKEEATKEEKKTDTKKADKKAEDKTEETKKESKIDKKLIAIIAVVVIIVLLVIAYFKGTKVTDVVDDIVDSNNKVGNSISNIRNYGYTAKQGSWIYYIAASEDGEKPAIYRSKKDGSQRECLLEKDGNVLGLNVYKDYIYFILIDNEELESNSTLSEEESVDLVNNKIYRMKLDGSNAEVINNNEFHNNCYEIYVVDNKVYYIGTDTNIYYMDLDGQNKTKLNNDETGYLGITDDYIILNVRKGLEVTAENSDEETTEDTSTATTTYETKVMKRDGSDLHGLTGERLYSISVVGDYIYYVNEAKEIYKIKLDGSDNTLISKDVTAYNMNVSDKYIYYMNYTDEDTKEEIAIYRMDLDGKNNTLIYTLDNYSTFLNVVDNKVVFMDTNDEEATINLINSKGEDRVKLYTLSYEDEDYTAEESTVETDINVDTTTTENTEETETTEEVSE